MPFGRCPTFCLRPILVLPAKGGVAPSSRKGRARSVFLRESMRRVLAAALVALLAATFLAVSWISTEHLALDSSNPLLRIFPTARDVGATGPTETRQR